MTPQQAKELLPIITAFAEGKMIQRFNKVFPEKGWSDVGIEQFWELLSMSEMTFRIKPEPREFWIIYHINGSAYVRNKLPEPSPKYIEVIHVVED